MNKTYIHSEIYFKHFNFNKKQGKNIVKIRKCKNKNKKDFRACSDL